MPFLNPQQRHTLALICETFVPSLPVEQGADARLFAIGAKQVRLAEALEEGILQVSNEASRLQLQVVLNLLESGLFNQVIAGQWDAFSELDREGRTAVLRSWGNSRLPQARQLFQSLKRLALFIFYSILPDGKPNPTWPSFGYPDQPPQGEAAPRPIKALLINEPTMLYTDVLVIGSGAGGGVVAGELSAAGQDVIVVEKGLYRADHEFNGRELDSQSLFEKQGALTTADLSMSVLAGSTLGGGTTINWSASLRPPDDVLLEWATDYGFSGATSQAFQGSLDAVVKRMNVGVEDNPVNHNNAALARGCAALGYDVSVIPRNVKGCEECGFCNFGCTFGAKQGTLKTYLQDAHERGARILVKATVKRVLIERGTACGAELTVLDADGKSQPVTIKAKYVVVAAGSVHTPAILLRSGLGNANIGANLHLHPVTVTYGVFEEAINPWQGPPMTRLSRQFANLDGRGYGVRLECAPVHPGIAAASLPWQSGADHKRLMGRLNHMSNVIVLTRDRYGGRVTVDKQGDPVLHYKLHPYDARHLMKGLLEAIRVHLAAGAVEVSSPHNRQLVYHNLHSASLINRGGIHENKIPPQSDENLNRRDAEDAEIRRREGSIFRGEESKNIEVFLKEIEERGLHPNAYSLFSAHQMSSCRIGGDSAIGAVDPNGESYEVRNLFVMDGSVLPTASGVNPMVTIMGVAHYLAQQLKARV